MEAKWYYTENGESAGPVTSGDIARLLERKDGAPLSIWNEGASAPPAANAIPGSRAEVQKPDGEPAPQSVPQAANASAAKHAALLSRARHEAVQYLTISTYLAICFGALLFYKAAVLESYGISFTRAGLAIVKALILGKFVLLLQSLKLGRGKIESVLAVDVLKKAVLFTLFLIPLTAIEEVIAGYLHGKDAEQAVSSMAGGTLAQAAATVILMVLIFIPYFAYREIASKLGEAALSKLLFSRTPPNKQA